MITTAEFGGVASAQGLDVSNFQGAFSWAAAKQQVPQLAFGICKATEGTGFVDADLAHNWAGIKAQGLVRGAYHFGHPGVDPTAQVQFFLGQLDKLGIGQRDILALDLEVSDNRTAGEVASWAQTFMAGLDRAHPHNPRVVYTMISFAVGGESAGLGKYPLWLADPRLTAPAPPPPWAKWTFWQWGTRNGDDADAFNGTAAELDAWLGSFAPAPTPAPSPAPSTGTGPYRHELDGHTTLDQLAAQRNTTAYRLLRETVTSYTDGDIAQLSSLVLPAGTRYYTANP